MIIIASGLMLKPVFFQVTTDTNNSSSKAQKSKLHFVFYLIRIETCFQNICR